MGTAFALHATDPISTPTAYYGSPNTIRSVFLSAEPGTNPEDWVQAKKQKQKKKKKDTVYLSDAIKKQKRKIEMNEVESLILGTTLHAQV